MEKDVINNAIKYVKEFFAKEFSGHDYYHTMRVYSIATQIAIKENANLFIVQLASLLHDVDDIKISSETYREKTNAVTFLKLNKINPQLITKICRIIEETSYAGDDTIVPYCIEGKCVQDADRLDAIGAIGIARAFTYGGYHNRVIYDPNIKPNLNISKKEYREHVSTTINHFYEKLFKLSSLMNTDFAKELAEQREKFMRAYIDEFLLEWNGEK